MKLPQQFAVTISGRTLEHMHGSQLEFVARTLARLLAGEEVDERDLVPYGLKLSAPGQK